jgi:orotate phosphoribosyltransferase
MTAPPHADLIRRLFEIGAIRFGEFTLSPSASTKGSGRAS